MRRASILAFSLIKSATVIVFFGKHRLGSVQIHAITATGTGDNIVEDIYLARLIGTVATIKDKLYRFKIRFTDESFVRILKYQPFFFRQTDLFLDLEGFDLGLTVNGVPDIILIAEDGTYRGA